jgi:hypothetical protein
MMKLVVMACFAALVIVLPQAAQGHIEALCISTTVDECATASVWVCKLQANRPPSHRRLRISSVIVCSLHVRAMTWGIRDCAV